MQINPVLGVELSSETEQAQVLQESQNLNNLVAYKDKVCIQISQLRRELAQECY